MWRFPAVSNTREELRGAASELGWGRLPDTETLTDVYRNAPYSVMVEFSRDGMVIEARLFSDAPDSRQKLPPRIVAAVDKGNQNKRRRIRAWFYDYRIRAS
jgi:hypothetical protein